MQLLTALMKDVIACRIPAVVKSRACDQVDLVEELGAEVHDARGCLAIPGLVDLHVHITGGGGEVFISRCVVCSCCPLRRQGRHPGRRRASAAPFWTPASPPWGACAAQTAIHAGRSAQPAIFTCCCPPPF